MCIRDSTNGLFWSPDGAAIAFYQKDESNVTDYPLVDVTTTPASLNNIKYPMNGMGSEIAKVGVYSMKNQSVIYLDIDTSDEHYLTNLSWSPDEKYVFLAEVNRDQNHMWFTMYDATSGKKVKILFEEKNDKWVMVRKKWDEVYARNKTLELKNKVDNKVLYKHLFSENYSEEKKIRDIIEAFVIK